MWAARELGEAHGGNGARLRRDEREREQSEASERERAWARCGGFAALPDMTRGASADVRPPDGVPSLCAVGYRD